MEDFKLNHTDCIKVTTNEYGYEYYVSLCYNEEGEESVVVFWTTKDVGHYRNGASLYYSREEVETWIKQGSWKIVEN